MYAAEDGARRRPLALCVIVSAHLLIGFLLFSSSGPATVPGRNVSDATSPGDGAGLAQHTTPPRKPRAFSLSFDRVPLVGPSTFAPPTRTDGGTHKVARSTHPS